MPNTELIRIVDGIARDKNIEREQVYVDIEQAVASGLRKQFNTEDTAEFAVTVDRSSGDISVSRQGTTMPLSVMGRKGGVTARPAKSALKVATMAATSARPVSMTAKSRVPE